MNSASAKTLRSQSLSGSYSVEHEFSKCTIGRRESVTVPQKPTVNSTFPNSLPNGSNIPRCNNEITNQKYLNTREAKQNTDKESPSDQPDKVKNKLMSMWHNIKY